MAWRERSYCGAADPRGRVTWRAPRTLLAQLHCTGRKLLGTVAGRLSPQRQKSSLVSCRAAQAGRGEGERTACGQGSCGVVHARYIGLGFLFQATRPQSGAVRTVWCTGRPTTTRGGLQSTTTRSTARQGWLGGRLFDSFHLGRGTDRR